MRHKKGAAWILTGVLLITASLCLTGYNVSTENTAGTQADRILNQLEEHIPQEEATQAPDSGKNDEIVYPDYVLNPNMEMPAVEIDSGSYIGILKISSLGLALPVQSTWSSPNLKSSPCRYAGSAYLDDLVICGHNYNTHFGTLKNLSTGDEVSFTDVDGNVFLYQVSEIDILQPTDVEEMVSGGWDLTLFTCTVGGESRVTIRCDRVQNPVLFGIPVTNAAPRRSYIQRGALISVLFA